MAEMTPSEMTKRLAILMERNAGVKGSDFARQLKKAPRVLPRRLRKEATAIVEAEKLGGNPKLERQIDRDKLTLSYELVRDHLMEIDPKERRKGALLGWLGSMAVNVLLLIVAALVLYYLVGVETPQ